MTTHPEPACRPHVNAGNDLWHKPSGTGQANGTSEAARIREAKEICRTCPLIAACLTAATDDDLGIWAGLTREERRSGIVRAPKPKKAPKVPAVSYTHLTLPTIYSV